MVLERRMTQYAGSWQPLALWAPDAPEAAGVAVDDLPRLTPYLPAGEARGAIVVCPGGGYRVRAAHEAAPVARWLVSLGIAAFVLDYRVAPYRHPAPFLDARRAVRLVRHHTTAWGLRSPRIGIIGFSAGGHLAATVATHFDSGVATATDPVERRSCRPDALVLCYPVISCTQHQHHGSLTHLLGPEPSPQLLTQLSLETQVTAGVPPAFLWHTADDPSVPPEHSLLFAAALRRHGVPFALHIFAHGRHGLGLALDDADVGIWVTLCARWLATQGFGARALGSEDTD